MKSILPLFIASIAAVAACTQTPVSPGAQFYPENPEENFSPVLKSDNTFKNLSLNRLAMASSSYDYNLTAHLATDGIIETALPAFLGVSTAEGPVAKNEME